jgi:hypothetical protein
MSRNKNRGDKTANGKAADPQPAELKSSKPPAAATTSRGLALFHLLKRSQRMVFPTLVGVALVCAMLFQWVELSTSLLLGAVAAVATLVVALYSGKQDKLPKSYQLLLWVATIATVAQGFRIEAEQAAFEKRVLGGDSYVYPIFEALGDDASKFLLKHGGEEFPVYDLSMEIFDMRKFRGSTRDPRDWIKHTQRADRSVFGPNTHVSLLNNLHPTDCYGYWAAVTTQRNGRMISVVQARKVAGGWVTATRVFITDGNRQTFVREYAGEGWDVSSDWPTAEVQGGDLVFRNPERVCT